MGSGSPPKKLLGLHTGNLFVLLPLTLLLPRLRSSYWIPCVQPQLPTMSPAVPSIATSIQRPSQSAKAWQRPETQNPTVCRSEWGPGVCPRDRAIFLRWVSKDRVTTNHYRTFLRSGVDLVNLALEAKFPRLSDTEFQWNLIRLTPAAQTIQ